MPDSIATISVPEGPSDNVSRPSSSEIVMSPPGLRVWPPMTYGVSAGSAPAVASDTGSEEAGEYRRVEASSWMAEDICEVVAASAAMKATAVPAGSSEMVWMPSPFRVVIVPPGVNVCPAIVQNGP